MEELACRFSVIVVVVVVVWLLLINMEPVGGGGVFVTVSVAVLEFAVFPSLSVTLQ